MCGARRRDGAKRRSWRAVPLEHSSFSFPFLHSVQRTRWAFAFFCFTLADTASLLHGDLVLSAERLHAVPSGFVRMIHSVACLYTYGSRIISPSHTSSAVLRHTAFVFDTLSRRHRRGVKP